jgi:glycosidase
MNNRILITLLFWSGSLLSQSPKWASSAVWYQIFPERFCNGDPTNDPKIEDQIGCWPHDTTGPWKIHPWTSDWYALQPWEKQNGKGYSFNITRRRYGGDIQGIINKIGYLKDLGINTLYLNPVFMAPSNHKYDGAMYHHIDPTFGPNPEGDRALMLKEDPLKPETWVWTSADKLALKMIDTLHKSGIRVIFDGVFNHLGVTSFAFKDLVQNGKNSNYANWFTVKQFADPSTGKELDYEGWFGVKDLPEIREDENGIVDGPKQYIYSSTKRWMDPNGDGNPNDGIDGWRLDVAFCVRHEFWKDWRKVVKGINPEAYLTAEVIDSVSKVRPYVEGDEFDAVMNYNFGFILADYFIGENRLSPSQLDKSLKNLREAFGTDPQIMMNLFDSHDTNRMASHIVNGQRKKYHNWGEYFGWSRAENKDYLTRKPNKKEREIQKMILAFMACYPGAPMMYYGTEAGMWGANDPDCRKPMVWKELTYEKEKYKADGTLSGLEEDANFDQEFYAFCKSLLQFRKDQAVLHTGNYKTLVADDSLGVFGFERSNSEDVVIALFNSGNTAYRFEYKLSEIQAMYTVPGNMKIQSPGGNLVTTVEPKSFLILRTSGY